MTVPSVLHERIDALVYCLMNDFTHNGLVRNRYSAPQRMRLRRSSGMSLGSMTRITATMPGTQSLSWSTTWPNFGSMRQGVDEHDS